MIENKIEEREEKCVCEEQSEMEKGRTFDAFGVESEDSVRSNYIETMSVIILKIERQYEQSLCANDLIRGACTRGC